MERDGTSMTKEKSLHVDTGRQKQGKFDLHSMVSLLRDDRTRENLNKRKVMERLKDIMANTIVFP